MEKRLRIFKAITEEGVTLTELARQLRIPRETLRCHMMTRWFKGRKRLGLMTLGLVERSGGGTWVDPYVYQLSELGKQCIKDLETHFPDLWTSL